DVHVSCVGGNVAVRLHYAPTAVMHRNIVDDVYVRAAAVFSYINSSMYVVEYCIVGDRNVIRSMGQIDPGTSTSIDNVVGHQSAVIGMIDAMGPVVLNGKRADVMDHVPYRVVIAAHVVGVIDGRSPIGSAHRCWRRNVVYVVAEDAAVRPPVHDAETAPGVA